MKVRLAKKITGRISRFKHWDSNYLPYSKPQQIKAIRIICRKITTEENRNILIKSIPVQKVPTKWKKVKGFLSDEFDNKN